MVFPPGAGRNARPPSRTTLTRTARNGRNGRTPSPCVATACGRLARSSTDIPSPSHILRWRQHRIPHNLARGSRKSPPAPVNLRNAGERQRNQNALYEIGDNERHQAEQDHIEERMRAALTSTDIPLDDRVRIAWTLGATHRPPGRRRSLRRRGHRRDRRPRVGPRTRNAPGQDTDAVMSARLRDLLPCKDESLGAG